MWGRRKCEVSLSCHANVFRVQRSPEHFYLCRNVLIGWEPDQRNLPQKNVMPCLFPLTGAIFLCLQMLQENVGSFESPAHFSLHHAVKISAIYIYIHSVICSTSKQVMRLNIYFVLFYYFQGLLFGFLWRLLPFEMNKRKWSCFSARSATSQPLNSPLKMILPKVWVYTFIHLYTFDQNGYLSEPCDINLFIQRFASERGRGGDNSLPAITIRPCALCICSSKYSFSQIRTPSWWLSTQNIIHWTV